MSQEHAKKFLDLLFNDNDIANIRSIKGGSIRNTWIVDLDDLKKQNDTGWNIYFGVNPRKEAGIEYKDWTPATTEEEKAKGKGDDSVELCNCFFVDFDEEKKVGDTLTGLPKESLNIDGVKSRIKKANVPTPNLIVNSGHGFHCYWSLKKSLLVKEWELIQERLIAALRSDSTCKNPERIMRLPGFKNVKHDPFVDCRIVELNESFYDIAEIEKALPKLSSSDSGKKKAKNKNNSTSNKRVSRWNFSRLDGHIKEILINESILFNEKDAAKNCVLIHCIASKLHKGGEDKKPSFSLGYIGEFTGRGRCFSCEKDGISKYHLLSIILHKRRWAINQKNWYKLAMELDGVYPGFLIKDLEVQIYNPMYPAFIAQDFAKKYYTIKVDEFAGMVAFFYNDGQFYYGHNNKYRELKLADLNSDLWVELKNSYWQPKKDEPDIIPFPVTQRIVNSVIDALIGLRNIKKIRTGYSIDDEVGSTFWVHKKPSDKDTNNLIVCNKIINYKTLEIQDLTLNLFCPSPLPVIYDTHLPLPANCDKFLKTNFETQAQIEECWKRDAFIILPVYLDQAFFLFQGVTGCGKGTWIRFNKTILGRDNWIERSMKSLGDKYGMQDVAGKLAIYISDTDESSISAIERGLAVERIKKVSGDDDIDVRLPGGKIIHLRSAAKFIYAGVEVPGFSRSVAEISRRIRISVFKKQYSNDKERYPKSLDLEQGLDKKLADERDSYFTHRIIGKGMPLLLKNGLKSTDESRELIDEMRDDADLYSDYWRTKTKNELGAYITKESLVISFQDFARSKNYMEIADKITYAKITRNIRRDNPDIKTGKEPKTRVSRIEDRLLIFENTSDVLRSKNKDEF